ncbi:MAG: hypothetical protein ACFFD2_07090 [Promethearchaeota archaeon]
MNELLIGLIGGLLGSVLAYFIGPYVSEKFRLRTKLAENYLVPFYEWCGNFYGDFSELFDRYLTIPLDEVPDMLLIIDYRELHETFLGIDKWYGLIIKSKNGKELVKIIDKIGEPVDFFWHGLEDKFCSDLPSTVQVRDFINHVKACTDAERKQMANDIRNELKRARGSAKSRGKQLYISEGDKNKLLTYLRKYIPSMNRVWEIVLIFSVVILVIIIFAMWTGWIPTL